LLQTQNPKRFVARIKRDMRAEKENEEAQKRAELERRENSRKKLSNYRRYKAWRAQQSAAAVGGARTAEED